MGGAGRPSPTFEIKQVQDLPIESKLFSAKTSMILLHEEADACMLSLVLAYPTHHFQSMLGGFDMMFQGPSVKDGLTLGAITEDPREDMVSEFTVSRG